MSCSNQKNTATTRFYHSINTRYNIHFNAEEAYRQALKSMNNDREENLSEMLYIFPDNSDSTALQSSRGDFNTTIDKTTKAIKLHSIRVKPKRDANRRNDEKYQAWLQQKEFTPFMDQVWLLLARSEFYEAKYLRSITTFMYISKIYSSNPDIVAECQLWIARAYTEMGWIYEAGNILRKMELAGGAPEKQKALYSVVKANYLTRNKEFSAAIPHLEYAITKEKDKHQKLRMKYLLGQLYAETGDRVNADKAFGSVQGMNTPYKYTFNAKLQQIQLAPSSGRESIISSLNKMAKSSKNKEYQDQLYYSVGNIYLQNQDTTKALDYYNKAVKESTRNGYDKAMAQIALGDIYFNQREYIPAQPCYSEALSQIKKSHPASPRVSLRSAVLDELVAHVKVVEEQDSLQHLAQLPEEERLLIINKKIADIKKEEEKKRKEDDRQNQELERENRISSWSDLETNTSFEPPTTQIPPSVVFGQQGAANSFYFYNEQAVSQGKIAFQKQWGNRKLEDDWRRRTKSNFSTAIADLEETNQADSLMAENTNSELNPDLESPSEGTRENTAANDIYSVDYYLQQLPLTPEAIAESNELIEDALFNMGKIYKDKLEDYGLAIDAFNTDISRFPSTPNLEEIYYQLFLIYMKMGDQNMMANYRNRILGEFAQGEYATPLSQPDYEWNFRHLPLLTDSLYNSAYNAYMKADIQTVRENYKTINEKYPLTDMMPKFAFLNALTYAHSHDAKNLESSLKELTQKYQKSDVTPLASEILGRIKDGRVILSDGSPITEFDWSRAYLGDSTLITENGKTLAFSDSLNTEYLLLLRYKSKSIDRNELLYQVADYNFSNYVIQTYDLNFETDTPYDILQIKGFTSFANIRSYINKAFTEDGLIHKLDTSILALPISVENYTKILPRLGLDEYMAFFAEHYNMQLPQLIAYWNKNKEDIEPTKQPDIDKQKDIAELPKKETVEKPKESEIIIAPVVDKAKQEEATKEPEKQVTDKQITADDLLTKEQLEKAAKVNEAIETVEDIMSNPVDGIKNLLNKNKYKEKLTKEEKAALKEQEKLEKKQLKELKAIEKAKLDSINKIEKNRTDSIAKAEKAAQESIKAAEKQLQEQKRLEETKKEEAVKAKQDARTQKEKERKLKEREQKERLNQQAKERKEKEKIRDAQRNEKERLQKERLREREKERKEKEKAQEAKRKDKQRQAEERRKQQEKDRK